MTLGVSAACACMPPETLELHCSTYGVLLLLQVLGGIGAPEDPKKFFFHLHSQLAGLGITGVSNQCHQQFPAPVAGCAAQPASQ